MCDFCSNDIYYDISNREDFEITMYDTNVYIEHTINLGDFGTVKCDTKIKINYCPICGRKLDEE